MPTIRSVAEYLEYLSTIKRIVPSTSTIGCFTFFRGQANSEWKLSPSLYREKLFEAENLLLTEIKHVCPNEFSGNKFDFLVKMQHFGMPTRLLDTTTNPLVALYFACASANEAQADGAVYVFPNLPVSWSTDPLVELVMDFVYDYYPKKICLDQLFETVARKSATVVHRLMPKDVDALVRYLTIPLFAVMPAKTNERIEAQEGAFFIFGMTCRNYEVSKNPGNLGKVYYNFDPAEVEVPQKIWPKMETVIIPASAKEEILKQLDILGINERKLFPDLSHQISHTVKSVKEHMLK